MSLDKLLEVNLSDEDIYTLLDESLRDITGFEDEITADTLLIDDLGLDSLGFLDLFFTIQTSIQKEVTNEQMRSLILEELGFEKRSDIKDMSDGEKDRVAYPQLKVKNFFNIIKKQLDPGLSGVDFDKHSEALFDVNSIEDFLQKNFESIKEQKIEEQIRDNKITDSRMQDVIRNAYQSIDSEKIKGLLTDRKLMTNIVKGFLKDKLDLNSPDAMKRFVLGGEKQINVKELLEAGTAKGRIFNEFLENKKGDILDTYLKDKKDDIISEILEDRKDQVTSQFVDSGGENLVLRIFKRRQTEIMDHLLEDSRDDIVAKILEDQRDAVVKEMAVEGFNGSIQDFTWDKRESLGAKVLEETKEHLAQWLSNEEYSDLLSKFSEKEGLNFITNIFEEEKTRIFEEIVTGEKDQVFSQMILSEDEKSRIVDQLVHKDRDGILDQFVKENKDALKKIAQEEGLVDDQDALASQILSDEAVQQNLIQELVDSQIGDIFDDEIRKQSENIEDEEILALIKDTFFTQKFKDDKIKHFVDSGPMQGELVEDFMRDNFDRIAIDETKRILDDHELRNKLIQDYIKDNYDPMEAMQLNNPEKMKELQAKITQKYIDDHLDEIITRYMNTYMDEMLESMPEEDEIEMGGDLQDEFMQKFMGKMNLEKAEEDSRIITDDLDAFVKKYKIKDPMMLAFLETNFDDTKDMFSSFERIDYDRKVIEDFVMDGFPLKISIYFNYHINNEEFDALLRREFTEHFLENHLQNHMDDMMELAMKKQFDFLGVSEDKTDELVKKYQDLLEIYLKDKIKKMATDLSDEEVESGLTEFFRSVKYDREDFLRILEKFKAKDRKKLLLYLLDHPGFEDVLKLQFTEYFLSEHRDEIDRAPLSDWLEVFQDPLKHPELQTRLDVLQRGYIQVQFEKIRDDGLEIEDPRVAVEEQAFQQDMRNVLVRIYLDGILQDYLQSFEQDIRDCTRDPGIFMTQEPSGLADFLMRSQAYLEQSPKAKEGLDKEPKKFLNKNKKDILEFLKTVPGGVKGTEHLESFIERLNQVLRFGDLPFETREKAEFVVRNFSKTTKLKEGFLYRHLHIGLGTFIKDLDKRLKVYSDVFRTAGRKWFVEVLETEFKGKEKRDLLLLYMEKDVVLEYMGHLIKNHREQVAGLDLKTARRALKSKSMENLQKEFMREKFAEILSEPGDAEVNLPDLVKQSETAFPNLARALSVMEPEQIEELSRFFARAEGVFHLSRQAFLALLDKASKKVFTFVDEMVETIEPDVYVFAQNWILSSFDFLVADRIMEELDDKKARLERTAIIKEAYGAEHSYRMFNASIRGEFYPSEGLDQEVEKRQIREFARDYIKAEIQKMTLKFKGV
jgi:acyl carrier protein